MKTRDTLVVAQSQDVLDQFKIAYEGRANFEDVTRLLDISIYKHPETRVSVGEELTELMPENTHQHISMILPPKEGESDQDWKLRAWCHPVISIMTPSYTNALAVTVNGVYL